MRLPLGLCLASVLWGHNCLSNLSIRPDDSIKSALDVSNCRLSDGSLFADYALLLPVRGALDLTLADAPPGVTIILRDYVGRKIAQGATIHQAVESGEFRAIVNGPFTDSPQAYTLGSQFTPDIGVLCRDIRFIGDARSVEGKLADTSCRLPDDSPYESYTFTAFGNGALEITTEGKDFIPVILVRTQDRLLLASGTDKVTVALEAGADYTILVTTSSPGDRGQYKLATAFTPDDAEECRLQKILEGSQDARGTLTDKSCELGDFRFLEYRLKIAEAGLAELGASSPTTPLALVIMDADRRVLLSDSNSGGNGQPLVRPYLGAGEYEVLVASTGPGDFALQYQFSPGLPETCPVLQLDAGVVTTGEVSGRASCREQGYPEDVYRIALPAAGTLELALTSGDIATAITLRDAKDNLLVFNSGQAAQVSSIVARLKAGVYTVLDSGDSPGGYSTLYNFTPASLPDCQARNLQVNTGYIADLGVNSCTGEDGQSFDSYQFQTPADGTVGAFVNSSAIDSFLTIEDDKGNVLRRDDNSFGDGNAAVFQFLPQRTYRLTARSAAVGGTGRYRADLLFVAGDRPAGCRPIATVTLGSSVQGSLYITSCQYLDGTFADLYKIEINESRTLDVTLSALQFDANLELLDSKGNLIQQNDDGEAGTDSHLSQDVDPGTYFLVAKSYSGDGYRVGDYVLSVK